MGVPKSQGRSRDMQSFIPLLGGLLVVSCAVAGEAPGQSSTTASQPTAEGATGSPSEIARLDALLDQSYTWGDHLVEKGEFGEAERFSVELIGLLVSRYGEGNWRIRTAKVLQASFRRMAQLQPAEQERLRRALATLQLGSQRADESRPVEASRLLKKAKNALDELLGPSDIHATGATLRYAGTLADLGDFEQAKQLKQDVIKIRQELTGELSLHYADAARGLGEVYSRTGMLEAAEAQLRLADRIYLQLYDGETVQARAIGLVHLVAVLVEARKFDEAEPLARESARFAAMTMAETPQLHIQARINLAKCLQGQKKAAEAADELTGIMKLVDGPKTSPAYLVDLITRYVAVLDEAGRGKEAARYRERLTELERQIERAQRQSDEELPALPE